MVKKKTFDLKKWLWIAGVPAVLGAIVLISKTITTYADLPKEVNATKEEVGDIKQWIGEQRAINDYYYQKEKQDIIYSPDLKWYWNDLKQEWRPVKELQK